MTSTKTFTVAARGAVDTAPEPTPMRAAASADDSAASGRLGAVQEASSARRAKGRMPKAAKVSSAKAPPCGAPTRRSISALGDRSV